MTMSDTTPTLPARQFTPTPPTFLERLSKSPRPGRGIIWIPWNAIQHAFRAAGAGAAGTLVVIALNCDREGICALGPLGLSRELHSNPVETSRLLEKLLIEGLIEELPQGYRVAWHAKLWGNRSNG